MEARRINQQSSQRMSRSSTIRLAISPCPNDTFMFDAIINHRIDCQGIDVEVECHDIEELNSCALDHIYDITKCSAAIYRNIAKDYVLLDSGAALGRGNGPLLVRRKGEERPLGRVAVPGLHTTANALLCRLFPDVKERAPRLFSEIARAVERGEYDGGVLIHEGRFVYEREHLELVADLGVEWEQQTGLPLPLGIITAKRRLPAELIAKFESLLRESIEYAFAHPRASRDFVRSHAREMDDEVIDKHISLFVNDFSLSLGTEGRKAIDYLLGQNEGNESR